MVSVHFNGVWKERERLYTLYQSSSLYVTLQKASEFHLRVVGITSLVVPFLNLCITYGLLGVYDHSHRQYTSKRLVQNI